MRKSVEVSSASRVAARGDNGSRVRDGLVDSNLTKPSVILPHGDVLSSNADEREGHGGVRAIRVGLVEAVLGVGAPAGEVCSGTESTVSSKVRQCRPALRLTGELSRIGRDVVGLGAGDVEQFATLGHGRVDEEEGYQQQSAEALECHPARPGRSAAEAHRSATDSGKCTAVRTEVGP